MQPQIKPPPAKLQPNKIELDLKEGKTVNVEAAQVTGKFEELRTTEVRVKGKNISPNSKLKLVQKELDTKEDKSHEDLIRTSKFETSSASEKMLHQHRHQSHIDSDKQNSGGTSGVEESQAEVSLHDYRDMDDSLKGSDAWIFPDQLGRFCVTTGGKKLMDFVGGYSIKPEIHQKKMNSAAEKVH